MPMSDENEKDSEIERKQTAAALDRAIEGVLDESLRDALRRRAPAVAWHQGCIEALVKHFVARCTDTIFLMLRRELVPDEVRRVHKLLFEQLWGTLQTIMEAELKRSGGTRPPGWPSPEGKSGSA